MFTCVTTKKRISTVFLMIILVLILLCLVLWRADKARSVETAGPSVTEYFDRVNFLDELGFTVDSTVAEEKKEVEIPYIFSDVYEEYNALQQQAGYDLSDYRGKKVMLYTLKLRDPDREDLYAHLMIYDSRIIGGDIAALSVEDGFMNPLVGLRESNSQASND